MQSRTNRIHPGPLVALGGAMLLLVSLWQPWFTISADLGKLPVDPNLFGQLGLAVPDDVVSETANAWQVFDFFDLMFAGLAAIGGAIALAEIQGVRLTPPAKALAAVGATIVASVAIRWFDKPVTGAFRRLPPGFEIAAERGLVLAALAGVLVAVGGYLMREPLVTPDMGVPAWASGAPAPGQAPVSGAGWAETPEPVGHGVPWGTDPL